MKSMHPFSRLHVAQASAPSLPARREVLLALGCLAASGSLSPLGLTSAFAKERQPNADLKFGVQLNAFPIDPARFQTFTLTQVKQIGYQGLESGFRNVSGKFAAPQSARRSIEEAGLAFFGIHIFLPSEKYDPSSRIASPATYQPVARGGAALDAKHLILSGDPAADADQLKRKIEALNVAAPSPRASASQPHTTTIWRSSNRRSAKSKPSTRRPTRRWCPSCSTPATPMAEGRMCPPSFAPTLAESSASTLRDCKNGRLVSLGQGTFPLAAVAAAIQQIRWKGWIENEEEREDLSQTGVQVIAHAYKAMKEAFQP